MNYLFLTNLTKAENFLNENSDKIFGYNCLVKINKIKRDKTYNEEGSLNLLYDLTINNRERLVRVSTSTFLLKEHDYNVMCYLYENGFNKSPFLVPQPFAYLKKEKILFYENIIGQKFADLFKQESINLEQHVKNCAILVKKVHSLKIPSFDLFDPRSLFEDFKFQEISKKYPKTKNLNLVIRKIQSLLPKDKKNFCHGDFNPNNLIIQKNKIYLIDFGLTSAFYKEIDLASFLAHSRVMLEEKQQLFEKLKKVFLSSYGDFDKTTLFLLMILIDIRLLEISIIFSKTGYNSDFILECLNDDLKKSKINWQ
ncbi:MAG: aminoglycoside phosphotransferase family protein [Patescibacteria group bacterium]|nr:aminoglycoside phosphotransferase family protein [Patescibacteria group bacterium]